MISRGHGGRTLRSDRIARILGPALALLALAAVLVLLGLAVTGSARAATPKPAAAPTRVLVSGAAAFRPEVAATSRDAVVQFGQDITIPAGDRVKAVVAGGGDVTIDGTVDQSVVAFGGDVLVRGTVGQSVVAFGGDVRLAPTAVVGEDAGPNDKTIVLLGGDLTTRPGAHVSGGVQRVHGVPWGDSLGWATRHTVVRPWWGFSLMGWLVQTAFCLVLALVAAALLPGQLRAVQRHLATAPTASLGWGALTILLVVPAILVVLVISIVGLLVVLPYLVFVLLAYFFAVTAVGAFIAQRVLAGTAQKDNLMLAVALGVVGTTIVSRVPVAGFFAVLVMLVFGAGAAVLAFVEWRRAKGPAAAPPAGGVPPAGYPPAAGAPTVGPPAQPPPAVGPPAQPPPADGQMPAAT